VYAEFDGAGAAALLGRAEVRLDLEPARRFLAGKRVLITGAGGSVGSALAELFVTVQPGRLLLADHHDHSLYALHRKYSGQEAPLHADIALLDVRNRAKVLRLLAEFEPEVVFHLAAYKHVPLGEQFPDEVISVNVQATETLVDACAQAEVEAFVYPSSDKAVSPPSLYGATKRLAETLVQRAAQQHGRHFTVVRYVNIIGTHGSVIETIARQVQEQTSVTITDPRMTRYWITMAEATALLALVAAPAAEAGVFMLDAGQEIGVLDLAFRLAEQLGMPLARERIVFTGARPGERLHEQLLSENERFEPGPQPGILRVRNRCQARHVQDIERVMAGLPGNLDEADPVALRGYVMDAALALQ
jgi:FlaA1/EpsC-like NDP-sugar epimerase